MFGRLASTLFNAARYIRQFIITSSRRRYKPYIRQIGPVFFEKQLHTASQPWITNGLCSSGVNPTPGGTWALISVRTNIRNHFPYPKEHIRVKRHGWLRRMSTPSGRRVIMRRILKGRHVLSH